MCAEGVCGEAHHLPSPRGLRRFPCPLAPFSRTQENRPCFSGSMPEKRDVAVLSITGIDVVLPAVPSFATMSLGHTVDSQGNTGRPRSEAALLESELDDSC